MPTICSQKLLPLKNIIYLVNEKYDDIFYLWVVGLVVAIF